MLLVHVFDHLACVTFSLFLFPLVSGLVACGTSWTLYLTFCAVIPIPMMLHIKFDQDLPADLREVQA